MAAAKVLLVDDDIDFLRIYRAHLEAAGFKVITACDGEEGLAAAHLEKPDVVVLDYMMARPTEGSIVAIEMKDDPELRDIPIVLVTSVRAKHPWWGIQKSDRYLPVDVFLEKPIPAQRLVDEVTRLVDKRY